MAFNDLETQAIKNTVDAIFMAKRPPEAIRKELDFGYRIEGQSILLFEISPHWRDSNQVFEHGVAKATYVKIQKVWKLYWMRQDLKWHRYEPFAESERLEDVLRVVMDDEFGCFFG
ncbi:MAG: DUF3024 domain-containing protein [Hydrogenovibrio sp.]|uniref:DUF3024 domain-containing protein n=1 Tax=Hydrogenovibrio sp. TaxID=2065821 RepID=UPI00286FB1AF|nr:DUF3024 domain-containing protein [Hydrogenovibrio sp.]MDR9500042.1 DUF3024 domain-containing protein [Hydrogenovibrio sp.]